jgi:DNA-binding XRE family transcriptional regulator
MQTLARIQAPDSPVPYTLRLPDGRILFVELPAAMVRCGRDNTLGFTIEGVKFLDRLRAMAADPGDVPTPGAIISLREALGLTQKAMGERIGVDKITISRWERGQVKPGPDSIKALRKLRRTAAGRGVVVYKPASAGQFRR